MSNEIKTGLWQKKSSKGTTYYSGKLKLGDKEYQLTLFKNNKTNEKQPDLNILVRDSINTQGKQKLVEKGHKNSELEQVKSKEEDTNPLRDEVFADFGQFIVDDEEESELPF